MRRSMSTSRSARRCLIAFLTLAAVAGLPVTPVGALGTHIAVMATETLDLVAAEMQRTLAGPIGEEQIQAGREALRDVQDGANDDFVATYLRQAEAAGVLAEHITELVGEHRFAGIAMDIAGQRIRLFLAGDDFDAVSTALTSRLPQVVTTKVGVPLVQLLRIQEVVAAQMQTLDNKGVNVVTVGADVNRNQVAVGVTSNPAAARDVLHGMFPEHAERLVIERGANLQSDACTTRERCPTNGLLPADEQLRGGIHLYSLSGGAFGLGQTQYNCTSAFAGRRNSDRATVVLTAGHCFERAQPGKGVIHNGSKIGTVSVSRTGGDAGIDALAVKLEDSTTVHWVTNNWIYKAAGTSGANQKHEIRSVYGRSNWMGHVVDAPVQKEGITTSSTVGRILATGQIARINPDTPEEFVLKNATVTSLCTKPGDSGGPVYWESTGFGVHSAGNRCGEADDPVIGSREIFSVLSDVERELDVRVFENVSGI